MPIAKLPDLDGSTAAIDVPAGRTGGAAVGVLTGSVAMVVVGSSVAVSATLSPGLVFTAQALRYAVACALLVGFARLTGRRVHRPRGREWGWLLGVAVTGLVIFNIGLTRGAVHAEPAVLGVAVACVPLVLALVGPLAERRRPSRVVLVAALFVTLGAALVAGGGRSDGTGLVWAVVVLGCEAGFTLLAVPVLGRHGPWGVSVHATWLAALIYAVLSLTSEGPGAVERLSQSDLVAVGYLAVAVTAIAFVLWYSCVARIGSGRAGLLTGVAPVAAAVVGVVLGAPVPHLLVWVGIAVVAGGLVLGLTGRRRGRSARSRSVVSAPGRSRA